MRGLPREEVINRPWTECVDPADHARMLEYHRLRRKGDPTIPRNYVFGFINKDGERREVYITTGSIPDTQTTIASLLDITDTIRAEEAIRTSERDYRSIIENMQDAFYRTDREGNLTLVSPSLAKDMGYASVNDVLGKNIRDDFYNDPLERENFLAFFKAVAMRQVMMSLKGASNDLQDPWKTSPLSGISEFIRSLCFLLVLLKHSPQLVMDLLLVLDTSEQDADTIGVILEVCGLIVDDKRYLAILPERVLLALPPHVPFPLLFCRGGIFAVVPEDAHDHQDHLRVLLRMPAVV